MLARALCWRHVHQLPCQWRDLSRCRRRRRPGTHPEYTRTHFKNNVLFQQHQQLLYINLTHETFYHTQHLFDLLHALPMLQIAPPVKAAPTSFPLRPRQFPIIPLAVHRILHPFLPVERVSTKNKICWSLFYSGYSKIYFDKWVIFFGWATNALTYFLR